MIKLTALLIAMLIYVSGGKVVAAELDPNRILEDRDSIFLAQVNLTILDYSPGPTDGVMGERTIRALRAFQGDVELPVTGLLDEVTADFLARYAANRLAGGEPPVLPGDPKPSQPKEPRPPGPSQPKEPRSPGPPDDDEFYRGAHERVLEIARNLQPEQDLVPSNAKRLRSPAEVMQFLGDSVYVKYTRYRTTTISGQFLSLKRLSLESFGDDYVDIVFTKQPKVQRFPHIIEGGARCWVDESWSEPLKLCYDYYVDPSHSGVLYAKGLPKSATNNGNASNRQFLLQKVSNATSVASEALENKSRYGNEFVPKQISAGEIMLDLLSLGAAVDDVLRAADEDDGCASGAVVASHGGYCSGKEPRYNPSTGSYR